MNKEASMAIARLAVMVVLVAIMAVNMALTAAGKNPLPFDESAFTEWLAYALAGLSAVWAWWKNNNVTGEARQAQETLEVLKTDFKDDGEQEG